MNYFDLHCDTLFAIAQEGGTLEKRSGHIDLSRVSQYDSYVQVFALFCGARPLDAPNDAHRMFVKLMNTKREQFAASPDRIVQCRTADDVESARRSGRAAGILSIEGAELIQNEEDFRTAVDEGVRIVTLAWNHDSCYACGALSDQKKGLTEQGKELVCRLDNEQIFADVSHLSERGFWDLAECTSRPILATHSNSRTICAHDRNLTDEQIREICRRGGLIGLNFYVPFVTKKRRASGKAVFPHIDHMLELGAQDALAIGADFDGCDHLLDGLCDVAAIGTLAEEMRRHNYSERLIDKIFFDNAAQFVRENF